MSEAQPVPSDTSPVIPVGPAIATWAIAWVGGGFVVAGAVVALLAGSLDAELTIPQIAAAGAAQWAVFLAALAVASRRWGTGRAWTDYAVRFRPVDTLAIPVGAVAQLALLPLLYLPLRHWWPDTFSQEQLEERARELADRAGGANTVLLVLIVVVGAPFVEELVYRGLLQRSVAAAIGAVPALVLVAAWFALVHPSPVEFPGLALAGLVFGGCVVATGRVGTSMLAHAAFNATGIAVVLAAGTG